MGDICVSTPARGGEMNDPYLRELCKNCEESPSFCDECGCCAARERGGSGLMRRPIALALTYDEFGAKAPAIAAAYDELFDRLARRKLSLDEQDNIFWAVMVAHNLYNDIHAFLTLYNEMARTQC